MANVLTIVSLSPKTYSLNDIAQGYNLVASVSDENSVMLYNFTTRQSNVYKTESGFTDFFIAGENPASAEDAVIKINNITNFNSAQAGATPVFGEEFFTGEKHLGGKDIYRIYVDLQGKASTNVLISGVDELVFYTGRGNFPSGTVKQLPYHWSDDWVELKKVGSNIELFTNLGVQSSGSYAVINYTKV